METVRIISFNIRCNTTVDGENAWPYRSDRVASLLQLYRPDLIGLQEVRQDQLDDLTAALPEFDWIGVGREDGKAGGEYVPIFYRRTELELMENGVFWLSETPNVAGSTGWDASYPRTVTWAHFVQRKSGAPLFFANTHFDHRGVRAQVQSAHLLCTFLDSQELVKPAIISGDFNFTAESSVYAAMTAESASDGPLLLDSMFESQTPHHGPSGTINTRFADPISDKIDHAFCLPGTQIVRHAVLADHWDGRYPSDHLPLLVDVEMGN